MLFELLAAFMSLIVATILYAVLTGERGCAILQGRAESKEFLGAVAFAFSVLLLLFAIIQLMSQSVVAEVGRQARIIVVAIGPALTMLFVITGAEDVASSPWVTGASTIPVAQTSTRFFHETAAAAWLPGGLFVASVLMLVLGRIAKISTAAHPTVTRLGAHAFPYASLGLTILAAVRSTIFAETNPGDHVAEWEVWAWLTACAIVFAGQAALLVFGDEPAPANAAQKMGQQDQATMAHDSV